MEMEQRFAVGGAPGSACKVLRLAQASDDLPGQFPLKRGWREVGARFRVRLRMEQRFAVGGAPSSARKVLRFAKASDDLPGQFPSMVRGRLPTSMSAGSSSAFASP